MAKRVNTKSISRNDLMQRLPIISLGVFLAVVLVVILVSCFYLNIPIVPVCTIVILEALLCTLLNRIPIWVHGLIVIAQVVAGVLFTKVVFMVFMAVVYVAAVALLYIWTQRSNNV